MKDLIQKSVFKDQVKDLIIETLTEKKSVKINSDSSAVIHGLKCFLEEFADEQVSNLSENCFNLDAEPFQPKKQNSVGTHASVPLDLGFAQTPIQKSEGTEQE